MAEECLCFTEVARLHRFFQDWFQGKLPESDFAVCEDSLGPGFTIVTPGGELSTREDILEAIRRHRGGEPAEFTIETVGRHCQRIGDLHLTSYEERQTGTRVTSRLSSAVVGETAQGFVWHSVHETWVTS